MPAPKKLIYFIGGASASGKSTTAKKLAQQYQLPLIELDSCFKIFRYVPVEKDAIRLATRRLVEEAIRQVIGFDLPAIIEGGWVNPARAAELRLLYGERFHAVFCGYPRGQVVSRLQHIQNDQMHWLAKKTTDDPIAWLSKQVESSRRYRSECRDYGFHFFDFSDFQIGERLLTNDFERWAGLDRVTLSVNQTGVVGAFNWY